MRKKIMNIAHFLERWDILWSLPIGIFIFWFSGYFFGAIMGMAVGSFDMSFVQPLFLAVIIVIGASTASIYVLRFHWKSLYKFIYSSKEDDEELSSVAAFKALQPWQKIALTLFMYLSFFVAVVVVYLKIL